MQRDLARMGLSAMLENIDSLPGSERQRAADDRDREADAGKDGSNMRRHVVRTLVGMAVTDWVFRDDLSEVALKVRANRGSGVFLDQERGRGVPAEQSQQAHLDRLAAEPARDAAGDFQKSAPWRLKAKDVGGLTHGEPMLLAS